MTETSEGQSPLLTEEQVLEIITFLVSSAEICLRDPRVYGTFRLIDCASRMIAKILENNAKLSSDFLATFKTGIDANKTAMMFDKAGYYAFLHAIPGQAAAELKRVRESGGQS